MGELTPNSRVVTGREGTNSIPVSPDGRLHWTVPFGREQAEGLPAVPPERKIGLPGRAGCEPFLRLVGKVLLTGLGQPETRHETDNVCCRSDNPRCERELYELRFARRVVGEGGCDQCCESA